MCIPIGKSFKVKLNKKGEGQGWKLFSIRHGKLIPLVETSPVFQQNRWIESKSGPGFFLFPTKKEAENDGWAYDKILKIKFRNVKHARRWGRGSEENNRIIIAKEIFIPGDKA